MTRMLHHTGQRIRDVERQGDRQAFDDGDAIEGSQTQQHQGAATDTEGALAYTYAVNKSLKSSQRMSEVCSGEVEL